MIDINKYKAFIFDFDGVVMDTESLHFKAWNKGFSLLGNTLTEKEYLPLKSTGRKHIVNTFSHKIGREITEEETLEICKIKDDYFKELCKNIDKNLLIKGIEDFLIKLKSENKKIAVASSASTTTELLKKVGLTKYFDVVADGNLGLPKKPDPAVFLKAASLLGVDAKDCLVFEDSLAGLKAAENAKMDFVAVSGIKSEKAVLEIEDFTEV
ncbi:MAG: HAD-IA family hydrolase [Clostridia bacterium]|nr:HAD-IA family hydrolase [Clostridia bacterium]